MKICVFVALGLLMAVLFLAILRWWPMRQRKSPTFLSQGPTVERLERLSHLVTMRVYVADVLTAEADGYCGAWLIRGDGLVAVNLAQASITARDDQAKQAVIHLPTPEVLQARVDHARTRTWEVKKTTWVPWRGDRDKLRDCVMLQAQRLVAHTAGSPENLGQAKAAAEGIIRGFYEEFGWRVRVVWEGDPGERRPASGPPEPVSNALQRQLDLAVIDDRRRLPFSERRASDATARH